jgi:hypothetical protein
MIVRMVYKYYCHNCGHYPLSCLLFKIDLKSMGLSVPHRKQFTPKLRVPEVNAIYRFVRIVTIQH